MIQPKIEHYKFVRVWQTSKSAPDAARKLKISLRDACMTASRFRAKGVPLKHFSSKRLEVNWGALANYAKTFK